MCGRPLRNFFEDDEDVIERSLMQNEKNRVGQKHILGTPIDAVVAADDWKPVIVNGASGLFLFLAL